jgi:hypothetical protein
MRSAGSILRTATRLVDKEANNPEHSVNFHYHTEFYQMAFRLDKAVIRGEISNQERNRVTGKIWILGKKQPLEIDLQGNCLRDLAGCRLVFRNPKPKAEPLVDSLALAQHGTVGDMTASRKTKVPTVADDELMRLLHEKMPIPYLLANTLYLEWFSEVNGRVVIETGDFQLEISERRNRRNPSRVRKISTNFSTNSPAFPPPRRRTKISWQRMMKRRRRTSRTPF